MKRDWELIRKILLAVEADENPPEAWLDIEIDGYKPEEVSYNVEILGDAGLLETHSLSHSQSYEIKPVRLTWEGHEFLEAAKNDTFWKRALSKAKKVGGDVPFELLKSLLIKMSKDALGL